MQTGPALECGACSQITPEHDPHSGDQCPFCGDDFTTAVLVEACPAGHPADCGSEDHHFGVHMHVREKSA